MGLNSIRIGRLAGIPIGVQPLWLLIVGLITWSLGAVYYPDQVSGIAPAAAYGLGLLSALLLFASILLHELGHAIVARRNGVEIEEIDLWLLGGVARMAGYPKTAGAELRFAIAGPAVTLAIVATFGALDAALPNSAPASLRGVVEYQAFVNLAILVFNLLPAFPLDGGRVARALIWARTGNITRATEIAATIGRGFGYVMIALGVLAAAGGAFGGLWLAAIGFFVIVAARAEEGGLRIRVAFSGREAGRLMSFPAVTIPAGASVAEAVDDYFVRYRYSAFPVIEGKRLVGLVNLATVERVPASRRGSTPVGQIAIHHPSLVIDQHQDVADLLERPAFREIGRAIVLTPGGEVGIISITDVRQVMRALDLATAAA
ncbi:MAG TPA: site-2 protease family protein [Solirubrobacterales bacterium]|jgi:Zn-dependent protease|nr:site-2 protease family protein [Solirubrobacterales bacterium]